MNICIFSTTYFPNTGGAERFIHGLANNLIDLGENPLVLIPFNKKILKDFNPKYTILPLRMLGICSKLKFTIELILLLNLLYYHLKYKFTVIQAVVLYEPGFVACVFGKLFKIPVVLRPTGEDIQYDKHSNYGKIQNPKYASKVLKAFNLSSAIVAISPTIKRNILTFLNEQFENKIISIENGVDIPESLNKLKTVPKEKINLLSVGRNVPKKDYPTMLKAVSLVKNEFPNILLTIVGGNEESLIPLISKLSIENNIKLLGVFPKDYKDFSKYPPKEVLDLYKQADIFVFSSLVEGCPNVILEAISYGLPIVGADSPGTCDFVLDGKTGLLFPQQDSNSMALAIIKLINNKKLYKTICQNQLSIAQNFSWKLVANKYLEMYNQLVMSASI